MNWQDVARSQNGAISRAQLARCGLSPDQIDGLIRRRTLVEQAPATYAARSTRRARAPQGVVVHRVALERRSVVQLKGLAVTDRRTTLLDLLRTRREAAAQELLDRSLQLGWLSEGDVDRALRTPRSGNGRLRTLMARTESGARAEFERRLHALLRAGGAAGWIAQYRIRLPSGTAVVDVAFPGAKLVIEVDGRRWHDAASGRFEHDRVRQNALVALGWRVLRVTWTMLRDQPDLVLQQIQALPVPVGVHRAV